MPKGNLLSRVLSAGLLLLALTACSMADLRSAGRAKIPEDIQEHLSSVISRNGFNHSLRSDRSKGRHDDSIYVHLPLDGLKRRHYSMEHLLRDVGRVCARPEYADLPIRIEIAAGDDTDRRYLQELILKEVAGKANITVTVESDFFHDLLITTSHPDHRVR